MSITTDYESYFQAAAGAGTAIGGLVGGFFIIFGLLMLVSIAACVLMIISYWKIFVKNNKPGWHALVPFLNMWTLFEIVGVQGWWSLIPFANIVFMYIVSYKLPLKMGKSQTLAILNIFFPYVVFPILAFGKDKTVQNTMNANQNVQYQQPMQQPYQPQYQQPYQQPMMQNNMQPVQPMQQASAPVVPAEPTQSVASRRCPKCNTELAPNAMFCPGCGAKQD